jgi:aspartate/methionine/tyrosine aminotransferase
LAAEVWEKTGVRVMPGGFMGIEEIAGDPSTNPGHPYVRIALVHDLLTISAALERVADILDARDRREA